MSITTHTPTMGLGRPAQCNDVGSGPASLVTVEEFGPPGSPIRQTKFTFNSATVTLNYNASYSNGGLQIYDFPRGNINILNTVSNLAITVSGAVTDATNFVSAIGTVTAATDGTLSSTEADIMPSTVAGVTSGVGNVDGRLASTAIINGTATAADAYLNFATSSNLSSARTVTITGWVIVTWMNGGDLSIA
jgi:hypothetical protein